jgi:hypothetical protein
VVLALAGCLLAHPAPSCAGPNGVGDLAGLFIQGCLNFAGDPAGLREWARQQGLAALPRTAAAAFLHGAPGVAFDASTTEDKLVLVSSDDGLCSAVGNRLDGSALPGVLETDLHSLGIRFRLAIERDDAHAAALHYREYLAARETRAWRILVATAKGDTGQAMLTAAPE